MTSPNDGRVAASLRWWWALPSAALGGLLLDGASPGLGWWPLVLPGAALVLLAMWQQRPGLGLLAGFVAGAAFWMPHISWLTLYLGPIPWLGLCGAMVLWFALMGGLVAVATRGLALLRAGEGKGAGASGAGARRRVWIAAAQAVTAAGLWVAREQLQGFWPYGGFAWGRLAHTQADAPLGHLASWVGFAGLSGLLALAAAVCAGAVLAVLEARPFAGPVASGTILRPAAPIGVALVALIVLGCIPPAQLERTGEVRIAAIQGDSKAGIFDDRDSGDVLNDHIAETERLLDGLEADGETVDLIVWPENSAEYEIRDRVLASQRIARLSERAGAPIVVGSVLQDPDGTFTNSSLVWGPDGPMAADGERARKGEELRYDKRFPVPFAEYMPNRDFFHALVPDLVDLVQLEYAFGTRSSVLDIPVQDQPDGVLRAGVAICFDIIFDEQARAMVGDGAQFILAPTNNADFGHTDQSAQQLRIAQLRAIETGRAVVNISTVGTSEIIAPDGSALDALEPFTADAMVAEVPLVEGRTPGLVLGLPLASAWVVLGLGGAAAGLLVLLRSRRFTNS